MCSLLAACALVTDLSSLVDGGADAAPADAPAPIDAPTDGFVLTLDPSHVTMDVGDAVSVEVTITRGTAFQGLVNVGVNTVPGLSAQPLTILGSDATGTLHLSLDSKPADVDFSVTVFGASADGTQTSSAPLGIHVGSLVLDTTTDASVDVPSFATSLIVKAWGAGGGGGESLYAAGNIFSGGSGGGGGFAEGTISVTPGETLRVDVGGGGPTPSGGGGYSGVFRGSTPLVVAGGGGGGSSAFEDIQGNVCSAIGANGHSGAAGGGDAGQSLANAAAPGTQSGGGAGGADASAGTSLRGGNGGVVNNGTGGANGGGGVGSAPSCGAAAGAGGGGGFYGGGGGAFSKSGAGGGGGGGSGYVVPGATAIQLTTGKGVNAANATDPECGDAGAGGPGGVQDCNPNCVTVPPGAGVTGRVIVRLSKP